MTGKNCLHLQLTGDILRLTSSGPWGVPSVNLHSSVSISPLGTMDGFSHYDLCLWLPAALQLAAALTNSASTFQALRITSAVKACLSRLGFFFRDWIYRNTQMYNLLPQSIPHVFLGHVDPLPSCTAVRDSFIFHFIIFISPRFLHRGTQGSIHFILTYPGTDFASVRWHFMCLETMINCAMDTCAYLHMILLEDLPMPHCLSF